MQLCDVNVALAITSFETPPHLQRIFNQRATIKLINFTASFSPPKTLQVDTWQLKICYFLPKLSTFDYLKCLTVKLLSWDQSQDTINRVIYLSPSKY